MIREESFEEDYRTALFDELMFLRDEECDLRKQANFRPFQQGVNERGDHVTFYELTDSVLMQAFADLISMCILERYASEASIEGAAEKTVNHLRFLILKNIEHASFVQKKLEEIQELKRSLDDSADQ